MSIIRNGILQRQQVLSNVVTAISNLPDDRLAQILSFVREIEDIGRMGDSESQPLTKREEEVLTLIANGYSRRQVGESLGISSNTAARHISTIYTKLEISSVAEATRYAIQNGLG